MLNSRMNPFEMNAQIKFKDFKIDEKVFFSGLIIWILLQMSRFVAMILITDIHDGSASAAWMYPAYLDMFAAILALPLIAAIILRRGLFIWASTLVYLAISIVDHFGNFVTTGLVGAPSIVQEGSNPYLIPGIQVCFDILFLVLLLVPSYYALFFKIEKN